MIRPSERLAKNNIVVTFMMEARLAMEHAGEEWWKWSTAIHVANISLR